MMSFTEVEVEVDEAEPLQAGRGCVAKSRVSRF
jgi:hypothetical protein